MSNAFAVTRSFRYGDPSGQARVVFEGVLTIDTTASGGATKGDLPASLFNGLQEITRCSSIVNDDESKMYPAAPCYDRTSLMVGGGASQAVMDLPNDIYYLAIEGIK